MEGKEEKNGLAGPLKFKVSCVQPSLDAFWCNSQKDNEGKDNSDAIESGNKSRKDQAASVSAPKRKAVHSPENSPEFSRAENIEERNIECIKNKEMRKKER